MPLPGVNLDAPPPQPPGASGPPRSPMGGPPGAGGPPGLNPGMMGGGMPSTVMVALEASKRVEEACQALAGSAPGMLPLIAPFVERLRQTLPRVLSSMSMGEGSLPMGPDVPMGPGGPTAPGGPGGGAGSPLLQGQPMGGPPGAGLPPPPMI